MIACFCSCTANYLYSSLAGALLNVTVNVLTWNDSTHLSERSLRLYIVQYDTEGCLVLCRCVAVRGTAIHFCFNVCDSHYLGRIILHFSLIILLAGLWRHLKGQHICLMITLEIVQPCLIFKTHGLVQMNL